MGVEDVGAFVYDRNGWRELLSYDVDKESGLVNFHYPDGGIFVLGESQRAKNYLDTDELRVLENISEQWMLYAQGKAMRGIRMTMNELLQRINQLLEFNGYEVMWEYPDGSDSKKAETHVDREFQAFTKAIEAREKSLPGPR